MKIVVVVGKRPRECLFVRVAILEEKKLSECNSLILGAQRKSDFNRRYIHCPDIFMHCSHNIMDFKKINFTNYNARELSYGWNGNNE